VIFTRPMQSFFDTTCVSLLGKFESCSVNLCLLFFFFVEKCVFEIDQLVVLVVKSLPRLLLLLKNGLYKATLQNRLFLRSIHSSPK
jgi:hypothetical protein